MDYLETLCLRGFRVYITAPLYYSNLNTIEFYKVEFLSETVEDLLLGCPILRRLLMKKCRVYDEILAVVSNSLTTLVFNKMKRTRMRVEAVKLKHISLIDAEYELVTLSNISSVTSATLSVNANLNKVLNFMPKLQHLVVIHSMECASVPECVSSLRKVLIKMGDNEIAFERVTKRRQEVLYKSRCDSRYYEIPERASADMLEVESLSKLTIEEATFRDIEERKMEFYRAIVEMEQDGTDEILQVHADRIQSSLEELVKSLSECCKKFGLHSKPTTLMELPSGCQPGIQEGVADSNTSGGYAFAKELTVDVQNVLAPQKKIATVAQKKTNLASEGETAGHISENESKLVKSVTEDEQVAENGVTSTPKADDKSKSPVLSPSARSTSPRDGYKYNLFRQTGTSDVKDSQSEFGLKSFDGPLHGTFDTNDKADSFWGTSKDMDRCKFSDDLFGHGQWTLPPIRTSSSLVDDFLPKEGIFGNFVPGTLADGGFLPKQSIFADSLPDTPADGYLPKQRIFVDSAPSTPIYDSSYSPQEHGEGPECAINFYSFESTDSGVIPQERFSRSDSVRSIGDFDSQDRSFQQGDSFAQFDLMQNSYDFDYGDQFSLFDDLDSFGFGPFKSSSGSETPRDSDAFVSSAFRSSLGNEAPRSEEDGFGYIGPFTSYMGDETCRADSNPIGSATPFRWSLGSEPTRPDINPFGAIEPSPRADADPYVGPFKSSLSSETPRGEFGSYGFGGPYSSSMGSETPKGDFDTFGSSGPFKSTFSPKSTDG